MTHTLRFLLLLFGGLWSTVPAAEPQVISGIPYKRGGLTALERERCVLDLYLPGERPAAGTGFPTVVWYHGGGLTEGSWKDDFTSGIALAYARAGVAVASVGYRLSPGVTFPAYVQDGAAAFAWVHRHIGERGGDPRTVFLSGHSAGGYLAMMVGLDPTYLAEHQVEPADIAAIIPVAGQTLTHYTVRLERGLPKQTIIADAAAPLHHVRKDSPPVFTLVAERDMAMRVEENLLLAAAFRAAGNPGISYHLAAGRDHGTIAGWMAKPEDAVAAEVLAYVRRIAAQRTAAKP